MAPHLRQFPRVEGVQLSGHANCSLGKDGDQNRCGVASGADALLPRNMGPGDVKLFGQSGLTQPSSCAPMQPALPPWLPAGNVLGERPVQSTSFVNSSSSHSVVSIQTSACTLPNTGNYKEPGSLSSFGRAGLALEPPRPTSIQETLDVPPNSGAGHRKVGSGRDTDFHTLRHDLDVVLFSVGRDGMEGDVVASLRHGCLH